MNEIIKILMERDKLTKDEARLQYQAFLDDVETAIESSSGIFALERLMEYHLGLEPDYLDEVLLTLLEI